MFHQNIQQRRIQDFIENGAVTDTIPWYGEELGDITSQVLLKDGFCKIGDFLYI